MVYIDDNIWDFSLDDALAAVSEQRREQALRYHHELGRRQCLRAYLLLIEALQKEYGIGGCPLFDYSEHGKPLLRDHPGIHFSLSHCREAVACVVGDRPVGIDIESVGRYRESLARYAMSDSELSAIAAAGSSDGLSAPAVAAAGRDLAFTRLWTMKEAFLKCSGRGLGDGLKSVLDGVDESLFTTVVDPRRRFVCTVFPAVGED